MSRILLLLFTPNTKIEQQNGIHFHLVVVVVVVWSWFKFKTTTTTTKIYLSKHTTTIIIIEYKNNKHTTEPETKRNKIFEWMKNPTLTTTMKLTFGIFHFSLIHFDSVIFCENSVIHFDFYKILCMVW